MLTLQLPKTITEERTETIVDDNGIEIAVTYEFEKSPSFYAEPGNPNTEVQQLVSTELKYVEVVIAGRGIDILPMMHPHQKESILDKLTYTD